MKRNQRVDNREQSTENWQRNLWAMWFTEMVAIVGFTVVLPLLPLYIRDMGVVGERQVAMWSGAVFSAQAATMAIFAPIWGALSDRYGRKVMVERAMFAGTVIIALMGLARNPFQLVVLRAMEGALTGTVTASRALVASTAPKDRAGYALGTLQVAVYIGATAGPLLGGVLADAVGYRIPFFVTSALLLIAATTVAVFVREPRRSTQVMATSDGARRHGRQTFRDRISSPLRPVLDSAPILAILGVGLLVRSASRMAQPTLPLFVEAIASPDARTATITGLIIGASAVGGALGGWRLGGLGDRVGYRRIMIACALWSVAFYAPQSLVSKWGWLVPLQLGAGFTMGGILSSMGASLATLSPDGREGLVYGVEATALSISSAIGPAAGSMVAAWFGLPAPFVGAALVFAMGGAVAVRRMPDLRPGQLTNETEIDGAFHVPTTMCCDAASGCAEACDTSTCSG